MENSIYVGLSKQIVLEENMAIVANNIANLETPGFRGQNMVFMEYVDKPKGMENSISFVNDYGQYQKTDPGPIKTTGSPLDLALVGPGFFGIQTPGGIRYTRGGNFGMNANGDLIDSRGMKVANTSGGTITIPKDAKNIVVDRNGVVFTDKGDRAGRIMVVEFPNEQNLEPVGNGLYKAKTTGQPPTDTEVLQGRLESSNVQPVVEMTRMIKISREYQAVQKMMNSEHERIRTAIKRLAQINA